MIQAPVEHGVGTHIKDGRLPPPDDFAEERAELSRVLHHPEISRSTSLVRFLTFICEKYFNDQTVEIREHTIAVKALGRKESTFDSQVDPIVRVTARALRKRLQAFYENEGRDHPLEIVIPLGRYIPQFVRRSPEELELHRAKMFPAIPADAPGSAQAVAEPEAALPFEQTLPVPLTLHEAESPVAEHGKWWLAGVIAVAFPLIFLAGILLGRQTPRPATAAGDTVRWGDPVWSDEFNGVAMQAPDPTKWTYDTGNQNNWGNHEQETYCSPVPGVSKRCDPRHPNAFQDGSGHLVIRAQKNADGDWTSARITTRGLKEFQYGRIEARLKLPSGTGLWPAFWMLGASFPKDGWPAAGTVDIAENVAQNARSNGLGPETIRSSLHAPGFYGGNSLRRDFKFPNGSRIDDAGFHTYGVIWSPGMIQFYVDDPSNIFFVQNASDLPDGGQWVFDRPFYLVMNLAVGGDWAGDPDGTTQSPADMVVDYVRVYRAQTGVPSIQWTAKDLIAGSMSSSQVLLRGQESMGRVYLSCATEPATALCAFDASTVDFHDGPIQQDTLTVSTASTPDGGRMMTLPGKYKLTITATTMSGDRSQVTSEFQVKSPAKTRL